jgi:uncharacterized protein YbaP (TraB family)
MKRCISLALALLLALSLLAGCGKPAAPQTPAPTEAPTPSPTETPPEPPAEPAAPDYDPDALHPLLWKVTDPEGHTLYLFGTIHVGDVRSDTVLEKVSPYLLACDALAVEFDLVAYEKDLGAAIADYQQFVYLDGSKVRDHIPEELYERCADLLREANAYSPMLDYYNLGMWASLVDTAALLSRSDLDPNAGMDRKLILLAYEKEIPVLDVESSSFQMGLLNSFPEELNLLRIQATLDNLDSYGEETGKLYEAWLTGDYDAILALVLGEEEADEDYTEEQLAMIEDYNRAMIDDRNRGMAQVALDWLAEGKTVFFAVGTGHMVGEAGLVQLLTDAGCTVERVDY